MPDKKRLITPSLHVAHRWPANLMPGDEPEFGGERVYDTWNAYLRHISGASVSPDSVIYRHGRLLESSLASPMYRSYYRFRHAVKKYFFAKKVRLNKSDHHLLVTDVWSTGHFHWICDVLPALWSIRDQAHTFSLLLPDQPYVRKIGLESIQMLGLQFRDVIFMKEDSFYKTPELYHLGHLNPSGHMHPPLLQQVRDQFRKDVLPGQKKIYISRKKAQYRKVVNEPELEALLVSQGFDIIVAEDFSFADQVRIFSEANVLASIHGAGLANALFMPAGSKVVELRRKENGTTNVGFWHLADALDQSFYYFNGRPDSEQPLVGKGCNLFISTSDFEKQVIQRL